MVVETAITIARAVKAGVDIYGTVSAILKGKQSNRYLEKISSDLGGIRIEFERISNHITMAANLDAVRDVTQNRQRHVENLRDVREALEPVQRAVGDDILSSAMIWTPEKMKKAMGKNPWEVLLFIQPVALATPPNDPNLVPIIFEHSGVQYIGWQVQGTFPMLFDCHYEELWKPNNAQSGKIVFPDQVQQTNELELESTEVLFGLESTEVLFQRGWKYANAEGVAQNLVEAIKWYRKAAKRGHVDAQCNLGRMYKKVDRVTEYVSLHSFHNHGNFVEAISWFRKAAEQGHPGAHVELGWMYEFGWGAAEDPAEAVRWYRKAAEQGYAQAQHNLGNMYERGKGVTQDFAEAAKWYRRAAKQGHPRAQYRLGCMYSAGKGMAQDLAKAAEWRYKAAEQGYVDAQVDLGVIYENGKGVPQDPTEAVKWYHKAAEQNHTQAQVNLGLMYELGRGVAQDKAEAARWYRKAAAKAAKDWNTDLRDLAEAYLKRCEHSCIKGS